MNRQRREEQAAWVRANPGMWSLFLGFSVTLLLLRMGFTNTWLLVLAVPAGLIFGAGYWLVWRKGGPGLRWYARKHGPPPDA